jgi:hypothetical protein
LKDDQQFQSRLWCHRRSRRPLERVWASGVPELRNEELASKSIGTLILPHLTPCPSFPGERSTEVIKHTKKLSTQGCKSHRRCPGRPNLMTKHDVWACKSCVACPNLLTCLLILLWLNSFVRRKFCGH